jgi:DNA-binding transcriptional regulator PaaX
MTKQQQQQQLRKPRIGVLSEAIIMSIALVGVVPFLALFPGMAYVIGPFIKKKYKPRKQVIQASVESLVRSGLVRKTMSKDGTVHLELTRKGEWEAIIRSGSHDSKKEKWDKIWRVVIFDVPQIKSKMRHELRRAMKLYGFRMLQQSVWVYPYACDDFVEILKSHLGVSNDVLYMKVSFIENDRNLRKEFGI